MQIWKSVVITSEFVILLLLKLEQILLDISAKVMEDLLRDTTSPKYLELQ